MTFGGYFRYFVELAYQGAPFCGWQAQSNAVTVQGTLEQALEMLLRENVRLTGAGRTDTGVHASFFIAHFDSVANDLHTKPQLIRSINSIVPKEIAVYRIYPVAADAHARFDALSRTYLYRIATAKNPFTAHLAYHLYRPLDMDKMNEAAKILTGYTDFTSFRKLHGNETTNLCNILHAQWTEDAGNRELHFTIAANRFLRNMVRAVVGSMLEIGSGKRMPEDMRRIIEAKDRNAAGMSVPPHGLYLTDIAYPAEMLKFGETALYDKSCRDTKPKGCPEI
ncbi:MAG: tRNA pseudouridine(38-40) synthase TruA [Bacteroidales bacterium]|jgi:tRNA pseudouridine38-40 synthase|nr:tRNA pseudouridine(38-40) synthase TruA [Bacteroidales bacterium]